MSVQAIQHAPNLQVWHDVQAQPEPLAYTWFFHGQGRTLTRKDNETATQLWERTLLAISDARCLLANDRSTVLSPQAPVTCYAGELTETSLAALEAKHMREHICQRLGQIGNAKSVARGDSVAAVKALQLLGELSGVIATKKTRQRTPSPTERTGKL
jgi:hypothetical protein